MQENDVNNTKNIRIGNNLTLDEKIDYIYKTLKIQKRNSRIKLGFKLAFLLGLIYLFFFYIPSLPKEKTDNLKTELTNFIAKQITPIIIPMVKNLTQDILKDMNVGNDKISTDKVNEFLKKYPELVK